MALKRIAELDRTVFVPAVGVARQDGISGETIRSTASRFVDGNRT